MGVVYKYGDNIGTGMILPRKYMNLICPVELAQHCMEGTDERFANIVKKGDIIVGGENFGIGSAREHSAISIKASGIACVIAISFGRIFYRNAINIGLPVIKCLEASKKINMGDKVKVDFSTCEIINITKIEKYNFEPLPAFLQNILKDGLINCVNNELIGTSIH